MTDQERINNLEREIITLKNSLARHRHLGADGTSRLTGDTDITVNTINLISKRVGAYTATVPLLIRDQTASDSGYGSNVFGSGVYSRSLGTASEAIFGVNITTKEVRENDNVINGIPTGTAITTQYSPNQLNTFHYGYKNPLTYVASSTAVTNTLSIDITKFTVSNDELVGYLASIEDPSTGVSEQRYIVSNTATTLTLETNWNVSISNGNVVVFAPVYFGASLYPWKRGYFADSIRFGTGMTTASGGAKQTSFLLTKESDTALSIGASFGSKGIVVTPNTGFTLSPDSGYIVIGSSGAISADGSMAISNGSFFGQLLIIQMVGAGTVTIPDNANTAMAGDFTMNTEDTLMLLWDNSNWVEISRSIN